VTCVSLYRKRLNDVIVWPVSQTLNGKGGLSMKASKCGMMLSAAAVAVVLMSSGSFAHCIRGEAGANCLDESWPCGADGENVTCTLYREKGAFVVSGTGAMRDYFPVAFGGGSDAPWSVDGSIFDVVEVTVEKGVTYIGSYAFWYLDITNLRVYGDNPPAVGENAFRGTGSVNLYVPVSSVETYASAPVWEDFGNINYLPYIKVGSWPCGADGDNVTCRLDDNGTLTVSGTGAMADYTASACGGSNAPWGGCGETDISSVVIENGVTYIGENAFFSRLNLLYVAISESVTEIGDGAFYGSGRHGILKVTILANQPPVISPTTFEDVNKDSLIIYVPDEIIDSYDGEAGSWAEFSDKVQPLSQSATSVAGADRVIPSGNAQTAVVAPAARSSGGFTAGPNPAVKSSGAVTFFWQGKPIKSGSLTVYDAAGSVVRKLPLKDGAAVGSAGKRAVGSWDLRDSKGRDVSAGTYLVKGKVSASGGKSERVSAVVGVR